MMFGGAVRFAQRVTHARGDPTRGETEFPPYTPPGPLQPGATTGWVACCSAS